MDKIFAVAGWIREDNFGRVVIDQCPSDEEHLRSAPTDLETNKPICRHLLEEFFTRGTGIVGKKGRLVVSFKFTEDQDPETIEESVSEYVELRNAA
jgi:hypothetical protein